MRYTIFKRGGYNAGTVGTTGGEVTGSVFLSRDPIAENEAATKNYLDSKSASIPVSSFTTGTIPVERLPEFSGDIVKADGAVNTSVKSTTVSPGQYTKVTVNAKGLVVGGGVLIETDVPDLPWNKITGGKPTTLGGYGITNALSTSGGAMIGTLGVNAVSPEATSLVNKNYVDTIGGSGAGLTTGGIIYRTTDITPTSYLKCNGGLVSKATYSALYAVVGDGFGPDKYKGNGHHWRLQYGNSNVEGIETAVWSGNIVSLPRTTMQFGLVAGKNRVYIIGGATGGSNGASFSTVFSAPVNEAGEIGAWENEPAMPTARHSPAVCLINNFIFILGGYPGSGVVAYRAAIDENGRLSPWETLTNIPEGSYGRNVVFIKDKLILIGGLYRNYHYATLNSDGSLGSWTLGSNTLPTAPGYSTTFIVKDKLYITGSSFATVYVADINTDGTLGVFSIANTLPVNAGMSDAVVLNDKVYMFTDTSTGTIYSATINADGTLGAWDLVGQIGVNTSSHRVAIFAGKIYSIGGNGGTTSHRVANITGGTSDYSYWYDSKYLVTDPLNFRLPDIDTKLQSAIAYIKY